VLQSPLLQFPGLGIYKSNLLKARVIIASYNDHVRLLSPERSWLVATKVYSGTGADIVMESISSSAICDGPSSPIETPQCDPHRLMLLRLMAAMRTWS